MSFMKTISAYEGRNADIFNKFDVKDELSNKKLKEILSAKYFGGKEQDFIGIYPSILANTALATFRIHLTNSTLQQVFTSNIRNLEVKVKFPDKYADLFLPSNLRVIGPKDLEAFFDNESDMLVWTEYPVIKPGESVVFEFQCIWKVIQAMDRIDIEIRGEYIDSPLVLDSFVYTTRPGSRLWVKDKIHMESSMIDAELASLSPVQDSVKTFLKKRVFRICPESLIRFPRSLSKSKSIWTKSKPSMKKF